jgi:integrase
MKILAQDRVALAPIATQRVRILDGALALYKRPGTKLWWTEFFHGRKHIQSSTKTADLEEAKVFAKAWYFQKQAAIAGGQEPSTKATSFRYAAEQALAQYKLDAERGKRSTSYVNGMRKVFNVLNGICGDENIKTFNQATWTKTRNALSNRGKMSDRTLHQYKNAVQVVLKQAMMRGDIASLPSFIAERTGSGDDTPRTWFNEVEYKQLIAALRENIVKHRKDQTRWIEAAEELRDFVQIMSNTGMRIGEMMNLRFCDVTVIGEQLDGKRVEYLEIRSIKGKRGSGGQCKSYYGAVVSFYRCMARHGLTLTDYKSSDANVFKEYHRDMFRQVLRDAKLYTTNDRPPRKRDLMSCRHTYICFRLLAGVPVYEIAINCRTSVVMVENHYARHLSTLNSTNINKLHNSLVSD